MGVPVKPGSPTPTPIHMHVDPTYLARERGGPDLGLVRGAVLE